MNEILAAMPLADRCLHARRQHFHKSIWPELANVTCREIENLVRTLGVDIMPAIRAAAPEAAMLEARQTLCKSNGAMCLKGMVAHWGLTKRDMVDAGYLTYMLYCIPSWWKVVRDIFDITAADLVAWFSIRDGAVSCMYSVPMVKKGHFQKVIEVFSFTREEVIALVNISTQQYYCLSPQQYGCVKKFGVSPADIDHPGPGFIKEILEQCNEKKYPILKELYGVTKAEAQQAVDELLREYGTENHRALACLKQSASKSLAKLFQVTV